MDTQTTATPPKPVADKPKKVMAGYLHESEIAAELNCEVRTVRKIPAPHIILNRQHWFVETGFRSYLSQRTRTPRGR
jgi:hypothetical protein